MSSQPTPLDPSGLTIPNGAPAPNPVADSAAPVDSAQTAQQAAQPQPSQSDATIAPQAMQAMGGNLPENAPPPQPSKRDFIGRILSAALAGMGGSNPANGSGFLGGMGNGAQIAQQMDAQRQQAAVQEQQQRNANRAADDSHLTTLANLQLGQRRLIAADDAHRQAQFTLSDDAAKNLTTLGTLLSGSNGVEKVGTGPLNDLLTQLGGDGGKEFAQGRLIGVPNGDGTVTAYRVPLDWSAQKNTQPISFQQATGVDPKTGKVSYRAVTIPTGAVTNGQVTGLISGATAKGIQSETALATANSKNATEITKAKIAANAKVASAGKGEAGAMNISPQLVDAIGTGKLVPDRMAYLLTRNPNLLSQVMQKYPGFDGGKAQSYPKVYADYTSTKNGSAGSALIAGSTAVLHLQELQKLNTPMSHIYGSPAYTAYKNKVDTVASELARFYGDTTIPAIDSIKSTLMSTLPGNRDAAIRTQGKSMTDRFNNYVQGWKNAAPSKFYEAPMPHVSQAAWNALSALNPGDTDRSLQPNQQQGQTQTAQPQANAGTPTGATMKVPGSDGKLHWSDGKRDLGVAQ